MMTQRAAPPTPPTQDDTRALYCRRCGNTRPLGLLSPGVFWSRLNGRTVLVEGGTVSVWCEKCSKQHDLVLTG